MKKATLKAFTAAHSWLGLATGMALFIAFYAGALTVFFHELKAWDDYLPGSGVHAQPARADALIEQVLAADPGAARAFHVHLAEPGHHGEQLYWFETQASGNVETHGYELEPDDALRELEPSGTLAGFVYGLHYTAGLPRSW
ncbi:MAG: PepSY-associated TM helix domain-containing protein, partial [Pseudomonadota bacterium]